MRIKIAILFSFTMLMILFINNAFADDVFEKNGNIYFKGKDNKEVELTKTGRDREPRLHPDGKTVYFVRSFEGEFKGEQFMPLEGKGPEDGILKEELWKVDIDGENAQMLFQNTHAAIDHPSGYAFASLDNIQFSPKGDKVYFETAEWVTSNALNVVDANGENRKMLGAGNSTKIIKSTMDSEKDYSGYIVTNQHRYGLFGGSYDWYWLYDPEWKEIGLLGQDIKYFTGTWDIKYTDGSETEIMKAEDETPVEFPETDEYAEMLKSISEANQSFTFKGKPIHPGLIKEFAGWISDSWKPITTTVDVAAAFDTNEYFDSEVQVKDNGYVYLQEEEKPEYFYYKWLGRLKNGLHVIETGNGGGGSGIFMDIYFVKFDLGTGFTPEGQPYPRLLMSIVRNHSLGDRDDGEIKVLPEENKVILGKSRYRKESIVLDL